MCETYHKMRSVVSKVDRTHSRKLVLNESWAFDYGCVHVVIGLVLL